LPPHVDAAAAKTAAKLKIADPCCLQRHEFRGNFQKFKTPKEGSAITASNGETQAASMRQKSDGHEGV
jgi:hypothetical protein